MERGHERELVGEMLAELDALPAGSRRAVLDVGCGEGTLLGSVAALRSVQAHGVDISTPAIELAARRYREPTWIVANADRVLPYPDASFDLVTSIVSRRNAGEIRRVLSPDGRAVIVVPGEDDVIELREAVLGRGERSDRSAKAIEAMAPQLELATRRTWKRRA